MAMDCNINTFDKYYVAFIVCHRVRVANELGAGNGKAAKFATTVSVVHSTIIGLFFCILIIILRNKVALIFSSSIDVLQEVDDLSYLLAFTILLNSVQPVLSGVAVGSGWQSWVAYINLGCYYVVGVPLGAVMGWVLNWGVQAEKATMHVQKWSTPDPDNDPTESPNHGLLADLAVIGGGDKMVTRWRNGEVDLPAGSGEVAKC
ncbi:hypothetical protein RJ640_023451 [Escallonia rubra]|uniref:Uncharacterized protein n=1 Tax=Escallonia rubra TaxID=112253 RepID=A0AA88UP95_9ASTE|nr:hypothetical protein RJ640_023451 [Escallonia rubra]